MIAGVLLGTLNIAWIVRSVPEHYKGRHHLFQRPRPPPLTSGGTDPLTKVDSGKDDPSHPQVHAEYARFLRITLCGIRVPKAISDSVYTSDEKPEAHLRVLCMMPL